MKKLILLASILLAVAKVMGQSNKPVRLAVIAETNVVWPAADVLTAELSDNQKIHLLERDEIEKVYREQGMSAGNRDDLKLGRILGADGLLLLNSMRTPQVTNLTARLIAVKPGVVLSDGSFPWPLKDTTQWAESIATYLNAFLPKLSLLAKDAIPISVVNLRAAVASADEGETERDLKLLTIQRLSQERQLFVLERQKMQLLSNEKELKSDESTFWDGSYLLDGVIDQSGYSKKTVTINARLTPPKGGAPLSFEVSGSRTNLTEVVNQLAAKVNELLKVHSTVPEWNATNEAAEYYDEAKWALKWGVYSEAQAAADSAWALGKQDVDCAIVRVKSYLAYAQPAEINELYEQGSYKDETGTSSYVSAKVQEMIKTNRYGFVFSRTTNTVEYVIVKRQPDNVKFIRLVHALELYAMQLNSIQSNDLQQCKEWDELGVSLLETAGQWLRDYYLVKQARVEVEIQLESARQLCREIAAKLGKSKGADGKHFWDAVGGFGVFWCETPEEGVALYKNLFDLHHFGPVRKHVIGCYPIFCNKLLLPILTAWQEEDVNRIPHVWHELEKEMCESTNSELCGNGYFFVCAETDDAQTFVKAYHISSSLFYGDDGSIADDLRDLYDDRIHDFSAQQIFSAWRALPDSTTKHQPVEYNFDPARFQSKPAIKSATDKVAKSETPPANELEVARYWEARLPENIRAKTYPDDTSNGPGPGSLESFCYREGYLWVETDFGWYADYSLANGGGETKLVNQRVFFRVNLNTLQSAAIPVNNDLYHPQDESPFAGPFRTFEVYSNSLYISSDDGIKRYSLRDKTWESLPVPVGGYARITALDGRIFLTSENAIIAMSPDGQASEVLASVRRRPARTILDKMDNYLDNYYVKMVPAWSSCKLFAPILPGPRGAVVVFLKGQFYLLAPGESDWKRWTEIPDGREAELTFSPEGLLILSSPDVMAPPTASELYLVNAFTTNIECLFADEPSSLDQAYLNKLGMHRHHPPPQWASPEGMRVANWPACLDGDTVWVMYCPPNKELTLLHFVRGRTKPVAYALHLQRSMVNYASFDWNVPYKWMQIEATPQGIVFGGVGFGKRIWFIPATDLQRIGQTQLSNN